jgi:hypothetical protein
VEALLGAAAPGLVSNRTAQPPALTIVGPHVLPYDAAGVGRTTVPIAVTERLKTCPPRAAVALGLDRRFKPLSEFTYTSRSSGVGVAVGVAVGVGVAVSATVGGAVGRGVFVGAAVGNGVTVAVGRGVLVAAATTAEGAVVGALVGGAD